MMLSNKNSLKISFFLPDMRKVMKIRINFAKRHATP